jgi:hypothetical protein
VTDVRLFTLVVLTGLLAPSAATAQTPDTAATSAAATEARAWAFTAAAYTYFLQDDPDYVQATATADRAALHLEGRYNYEEINAASAWLGYNLAAQGSVALAFTPIVGGVFGSLTGVGLGYEGSVGWKQLELYSEGEWILDTEDASNNFFYSWSQLIYAPAGWVNFGLVTQRTKLVDTDREISPGPFLGFSYKSVDLTAFAFNVGADDAYLIVGLDVAF